MSRTRLFGVAGRGQLRNRMRQIWRRRQSPPGYWSPVDEVKVVVARSERPTLRVGGAFLKVDADQARIETEVEAMPLAPVPTPKVLWRKPPVLAIDALPGRRLGALAGRSHLRTHCIHCPDQTSQLVRQMASNATPRQDRGSTPVPADRSPAPRQPAGSLSGESASSRHQDPPRRASGRCGPQGSTTRHNPITPGKTQVNKASARFAKGCPANDLRVASGMAGRRAPLVYPASVRLCIRAMPSMA